MLFSSSDTFLSSTAGSPCSLFVEFWWTPLSLGCTSLFPAPRDPFTDSFTFLTCDGMPPAISSFIVVVTTSNVWDGWTWKRSNRLLNGILCCTPFAPCFMGTDPGLSSCPWSTLWITATATNNTNIWRNNLTGNVILDIPTLLKSMFATGIATRKCYINLMLN